MALVLHDNMINNATLGTYTHTCANTALYTVNVQMQCRPASSISIAIKQGVTTLATSAVPSATQNHVELQVSNINCTAADVLSVVITSAAAKDALPQATQGTIRVGKVLTP